MIFTRVISGSNFGRDVDSFDWDFCVFFQLRQTHFKGAPYRPRPLLHLLFTAYISLEGSRDGSVGTATRYGLEGPGIESPVGARFSAPIQTGSEAHPASCTMGTGSFPGVKAAGAWC